MMSLDKFLERALEIPFVDRGRSWDGVDCWGIIVLAYQEVKGIELPSYAETYSSTKRLKQLSNLIDKGKDSTDKWHKVPGPINFGCVLLKVNGYASHIGLTIGTNGDFLHTEKATGVLMDNVNTPMWLKEGQYNKIEGYYEYR